MSASDGLTLAATTADAAPAAPDVDGHGDGGDTANALETAQVIAIRVKDAVEEVIEDAFPQWDDSVGPPELLMCGPKTIGTEQCGKACPRICPCVLALHGPLQLAFLLGALLSLACLVYEITAIDLEPSSRNTTAIEDDEESPSDVARILTAACFLAAAAYLTWIGKGIYIMKWIRLEVVKLMGLNKKLEASIDELVLQSTEFKDNNAEHGRLNQEMAQQLDELHGQQDTLALQNMEGQKINKVLTAQVAELKQVEHMLETLALECSAGVDEVRGLLSRLEKDVRIDTVNTVIQFFDRTDRNKNGKIDPEEINLFVDNLSMLWKHLPGYNKDKMKAAIVEQAGVTMEQLNEMLVEALRVEDDVSNPLNIGSPRPSKWGFEFGGTHDPPV